jgi:DNA repair protein RecO (recombination protein O)
LGSRFFTTEALVIGSMRYREADRIVTLYTRERGRLGAIAKGVRRTKSKVGGRLEPFSLVRASLYSGRGLYTVVGVDTLRTFQAVRDELFRMQEGARLLAAVRHLFPGEEGSVPAFNLLVLATRLKLLVLLGYAPEMSRCAACSGEGSLYGFSPSLGGVVCGPCATAGAASCFALSAGAISALRALLDNPLADVEHLCLDDRAIVEVEQVVTQTLAYHGH